MSVGTPRTFIELLTSNTTVVLFGRTSYGWRECCCDFSHPAITQAIGRWRLGHFMSVCATPILSTKERLK